MIHSHNVFKFFLFSLFASFSTQKRPNTFESCQNGVGTENCFAKMIADPSEIAALPDIIMKETLLATLKTSLQAMDLPKETIDRITDDAFLKEKIEKAMTKRKSENIVDISVNKESSNTSSSTTSYPALPKYAPYGGQSQINDWYDFYHYFPHLANRIRLWKLEFKSSTQKHWKRFKGCANPGHLVDWLVPDIEEVKRQPRRKGGKIRRHRNSDEFTF